MEIRFPRTARLHAMALLGFFACSSPAAGRDSGPGGRLDAMPDRPMTPDAGAATGGELEYRYTEHLGKLTGSSLNPVEPVGMSGTDLGVAFSRDGLVAFLFGDAWQDNRDSMALASPNLPANGTLPKLTWSTGSGGDFIPFRVPGVDLGAFNVPVEAVPSGARTYYFFSAGYDFGAGVHSHSVLAHGEGLIMSPLTLDHNVLSDKFINVNVVVEEGTAWIFGSGPYRKSPVYLARVPLDQIADRQAWRYAPSFEAGEAAAEPIMADPCVGELSVRRHPSLGLWLMAYNCGEPRGIHLRTARAPTGPWSEPMLIYKPGLGYQHFMHAKESIVGYDDGLSDRGREEEWGGEYGPYLVTDWFASPAPGVYEITYVLSSWNPYQVHLMRTVLAEPGVEAEPPVKGEGLPPAALTNGDFSEGCASGWQSSGDSFVCFRDDSGAWRVTSHTPAEGDAAVGTMWQNFPVDSGTSELRFFIHGGDAEVKLIDGDEVVRRSHGRRSNELETEVRWQLETLRGRDLRLVIEDTLTGPWGFVGARGFELR